MINYSPDKKKKESLNKAENYNNNALSIFSHYQTTDFPQDSRLYMQNENSKMSKVRERAGTTSPK